MLSRQLVYQESDLASYFQGHLGANWLPKYRWLPKSYLRFGPLELNEIYYSSLCSGDGPCEYSGDSVSTGVLLISNGKVHTEFHDTGLVPLLFCTQVPSMISE